MNHTEQQKAEFKERYSARRKRQLAVSVPLIALVFAVVLTENRQADTLLGLPPAIVVPVLVAIIGATLVFSFRNWRCPACDKYLGRSFNPKHCQSCGVELRS